MKKNGTYGTSKFRERKQAESAYDLGVTRWASIVHARKNHAALQICANCRGETLTKE